MINLESYAKAIDKIYENWLDLRREGSASEKEYIKSNEKLQALYRELEELIPDDKKHLVDELACTATDCLALEGRYLYRQGIEDEKCIYDLINLIKESTNTPCSL